MILDLIQNFLLEGLEEPAKSKIYKHGVKFVKLKFSSRAELEILIKFFDQFSLITEK